MSNDLEQLRQDCQARLAPREERLDADVMALRLLEWGDAGKSIFVLHGITSSARTWWRVGPALAAAGYHVYALDMPGHGLSARPDGSGYRFEQTAHTIAAAIEQTGVQGSLLLGHSWGGLIALLIATMPERKITPERLVLVDPPLQVSRESAEMLAPQFAQGIGELCTAHTVEQYLAKNPRWERCDAYWKAEAMEQCDPHAPYGFFLQNAPWDLVSLLAQTSMPLLLLSAAPQYTMLPSQCIPQIEQICTTGNRSLEIIAGSSHNMHRDSFGPFIDAVLHFADNM